MLGHPIWQTSSTCGLFQETIAEIRPAVLLETGTNRGGSALFYAHLFDLMGSGAVVTVDIERMHELKHPRITALIGSSLSAETLSVMREHAEAATGPVMVILDSDHAEAHVRAELDAYSNFVTPGSFLLAQDGVIDTLHRFRRGRPGPLPAIRSFLASHPEFDVDEERSRRFLISTTPRDGCAESLPSVPDDEITTPLVARLREGCFSRLLVGGVTLDDPAAWIGTGLAQPQDREFPELQQPARSPRKPPGCRSRLESKRRDPGPRKVTKPLTAEVFARSVARQRGSLVAFRAFRAARAYRRLCDHIAEGEEKSRCTWRMSPVRVPGWTRRSRAKGTRPTEG